MSSPKESTTMSPPKKSTAMTFPIKPTAMPPGSFHPEIPELVSSRLSTAWQQNSRATKARTVSAVSRVSTLSVDTQGTSVSDYLEAKIQELEADKDYLKNIKDGLLEGFASGVIPEDTLQKKLGDVLSSHKTQTSALRIMKRNERNMVEDLEAKVTGQRSSPKRPRQKEPKDCGLLEHAYRDTIIPRVMSAVACQVKSSFNTRKFKKSMLEFYGIRPPNVKPNWSWCHILGIRIPKAHTKAAHIVPKSLSHEEIAHIFGSEDEVARDPRNSLSLYSDLECLLDSGVIVIVPQIGDSTQWKCVLLDESRGDEAFLPHLDGSVARLKDLDGKLLTFLNENRPRHRYLYFRFLISYLNLKRFKVITAAQKVESRRFWPSEGAYLQRSTLVTLARCISGCEIPAKVIEGMTFDGENKPAGNEEDLAMTASATIRDDADRLRDAMLASLSPDTP